MAWYVTASISLVSALAAIVTTQVWQDRRDRRKQRTARVQAQEEAYAVWLGACWRFVNHCVEVRSKMLAYGEGNEGEVKSLIDDLHVLATGLDGARTLALLREEDDAFRRRGDQIHGQVSYLGIDHNPVTDSAEVAINELRSFQMELARRLSHERRHT